MQDLNQWVNQHLYPHQVHSFAVYEDEHLESNDKVMATVYFKGAANSSLTLPDNISTPIFKTEVNVMRGPWDGAYEWAANRVRQLGLRESRTIPATANKENENQKVVAVLSWERSVEDSLNVRNGGCCTVF